MKRHFPAVLLIAALVAFTLGIIQLFQLRFESGDVYPAYSSLRSDPLGTMALYESLARLPGMTVERDLSTSNRLPATDKAVYLHLATSIEAWQSLPGELFDEIQRFVTAGNRLVVTTFPQAVRPPPVPETAAQKREREAKEMEAEKEAKEKKEPTSQERWGMDFKVRDLNRDGTAYEPAQVRNVSGLPLPETLDWHSGAVMTDLDPAWKPIYIRGGDPVVSERAFGNGTVVVATDSYFLSNEAMLNDRHADLLAWLIGSGRNIYFDEGHLGITESPGVSTLMRKYRLYWVIAGLILLAGLFVWKNSVSLLPRDAIPQSAIYVEGKDAAAGFVTLLRRSIPAGDLLATCFQEWKKSAGQTGKHSSARIRQAEAVFESEQSRPAKDRDPVKAYQTISKHLQNKSNEH